MLEQISSINQGEHFHVYAPVEDVLVREQEVPARDELLVLLAYLVQGNTYRSRQGNLWTEEHKHNSAVHAELVGLLITLAFEVNDRGSEEALMRKDLTNLQFVLLFVILKSNAVWPGTLAKVIR